MPEASVAGPTPNCPGKGPHFESLWKYHCGPREISTGILPYLLITVEGAGGLPHACSGYGPVKPRVDQSMQKTSRSGSARLSRSREHKVHEPGRDCLEIFYPSPSLSKAINLVQQRHSYS